MYSYSTRNGTAAVGPLNHVCVVGLRVRCITAREHHVAPRSQPLVFPGERFLHTGRQEQTRTATGLDWTAVVSQNSEDMERIPQMKHCCCSFSTTPVEKPDNSSLAENVRNVPSYYKLPADSNRRKMSGAGINIKFVSHKLALISSFYLWRFCTGVGTLIKYPPTRKIKHCAAPLCKALPQPPPTTVPIQTRTPMAGASYLVCAKKQRWSAEHRSYFSCLLVCRYCCTGKHNIREIHERKCKKQRVPGAC